MKLKARTVKLMWDVLGMTLLLCIAILFYALFNVSSENGKTSRENQGYVRYIACVIEVRNTRNVVAVDDKTSDACWYIAEKQVGVKLTRYSDLEIERALGH